MRIGIIGHFGGDKEYTDGQTVKTRSVYNALYDAGYRDIAEVDTYFVKKSPVRFILSFLKAVLTCKKYIVLVSAKGRRILFPVLYGMSRVFRREIYHYAIGGRLYDELLQKPRWIRYVSSFQGNWMESRLLAEQLRSLGIRNADYVPNIKRITVLREADLPKRFTAPYRFCTFSRVMKEKGIEDAIGAVCAVNREYGDVARLDIYGPVESGFEETLAQLTARSDSAARYCGVAEPDKSVDTLKDYYMTLFPTRYWREGMPGTVLDSLAAGVPVIARRWKYCDEMLENHVTGLVYAFDEPESLPGLIRYAIDHEEIIREMKINCLRKAAEYDPASVIHLILDKMGLSDGPEA